MNHPIPRPLLLCDLSDYAIQEMLLISKGAFLPLELSARYFTDERDIASLPSNWISSTEKFLIQKARTCPFLHTEVAFYLAILPSS